MSVAGVRHTELALPASTPLLSLNHSHSWSPVGDRVTCGSLRLELHLWDSSASSKYLRAELGWIARGEVDDCVLGYLPLPSRNRVVLDASHWLLPSLLLSGSWLSLLPGGSSGPGAGLASWPLSRPGPLCSHRGLPAPESLGLLLPCP